MNLKENLGVQFLTFEIYKTHPDLIAIHSTRVGGVSSGHFESLNLGFARGDDKNLVFENYKLFSKAIGVDHKKLVLSDQWHHNNILIADYSHKGMGIVKERTYHDYDGIITNKKGLPLVTFYADCVPIYFYDPIQEVIAMAHAGWRGTSTSIVKDMVELFISEYNSKSEYIKVGIGPAICKSCYQVDQTVIDSMAFDFDVKAYYDFNISENRYYIDLKGINKEILITCGIKEDNIEVTEYCTKCHPELFFSHRRHGNNRGTQIGVMMMEEK